MWLVLIINKLHGSYESKTTEIISIKKKKKDKVTFNNNLQH